MVILLQAGSKSVKPSHLREKSNPPHHQSWILNTLIFGYLEIGDLESAKRLAEQLESLADHSKEVALRDLSAAYVVLGKGEKALTRIEKHVPKPSEVRGADEAAYYLTVAASWIGNFDLAEKSCRTAQKSRKGYPFQTYGLQHVMTETPHF